MTPPGKEYVTIRSAGVLELWPFKVSSYRKVDGADYYYS